MKSHHPEFDDRSEGVVADTTLLYGFLIIVLFGLGVIVGHGF